MAILLIRHGETLGNRNRVVQVPETPLSEHGLEQAARLARRLASSAISEIWTSPQTRARMTAAAIESASGLAAREVKDLEERNFGAIRGTPYAELGFDLMGPDYDPPEGESWSIFHDRVDRAWEEIEGHWLDHYAAAVDPGHLAIVSHGLFCRSLIERRLLPGQSLEDHRDDQGTFFMRNTGLTVIEPNLAAESSSSSSSLPSLRKLPSSRLAHRVALIGCTAHLDEDEPEALGRV